jgi:hypothetical protein
MTRSHRTLDAAPSTSGAEAARSFERTRWRTFVRRYGGGAGSFVRRDRWRELVLNRFVHVPEIGSAAGWTRPIDFSLVSMMTVLLELYIDAGFIKGLAYCQKFVQTVAMGPISSS